MMRVEVSQRNWCLALLKEGARIVAETALKIVHLALCVAGCKPWQ